jgi:hypothetical protein
MIEGLSPAANRNHDLRVPLSEKAEFRLQSRTLAGGIAPIRQCHA